MSRRILKRPQAEHDIEDCFVYIAEDNPDKGIGFLANLESELTRLGDFPQLGTKLKFGDAQLQNIRMWRVRGYENFLIFYRADEKSIEIIRVLHHARNIEAFFG
jgi:toxin ParE1/3/4